MINTTRVTDRRRIRFSSMVEILDDVEYLASGDPPGSTGNWTSAQIVQHVTKVINYSIDGFPVPKAGLPMRLMGRMMRKSALRRAMRPGFPFPKNFEFLAPDPNVIWEDAVDSLREAIGRLESQRMTRASPILGKLTHEQWEQLHCRHAEMHFSFMHPA